MSEEAKKTAENEEAKVEEAEVAEETAEQDTAPAEETPVKEENSAETDGSDEADEANEEISTQEAKGKHRTTLRFLLLVILLAVAWFAWQKHQRVKKFNDAMEAYNEGKLEQAEDMFMQLYKSSSGDIKKRAKVEVIRVILDRGDAPNNNVEQSVIFYKRAYDIDPNALEMHHLRALKNFLKKQDDPEATAELDKLLKVKMDALKKVNEEAVKEQQAAEKAQDTADKLKKEATPKE